MNRMVGLLFIATRVLLIGLFAQSISSSEISQTRHLNGSATIYCSSGNSSVAKPSEVEWKHNGIVVVVSDSARISKTSENNLLIKSLDYSDAGDYSCVNGNMTLGITTLIIEGKPSLTQTFAPHTILEGSKVNITCTANSIPAASISWEKNGEPLSEAASQVSILTSVNSDVVQSRVEILSASYLQNGTFKCIASNKHGMIMHQASMQVYVGAYISKPPMSKHFARKGTNLTLTCSAFGNPIPTVLWDNKFVNMSDTSHFRIQKRISGFITTSNLEIRNIQDSVGGNYTCLAANQFVHHTHRAVSQVFIQGYEKCLKLKVKHVAQTKASVEWDLSCTKQWPSSWVYVDVIVYKDGAAASVDTFERSPANRTATVLGLRPFREYRVKVRTIAKDAATGWQSEAVKFVTAQAAPSVPRSLNAVGKSLTSIEVRWKAPVELNGIVQQYEIKCRHSQQFGFANDFNMTIDAVARPMRSIVIENLKMNTVYNVSVRERTGPGLWSIVVSTTTTTKEGALAPRNVLVSIISNSSVAVNWSSLAKEDVNGNLIGYLVLVSDNQGVLVFNRTVLSTQSQIKINMLQPSTYYSMKVSGLTKAGPGEQATVQFSTAKGVPSAPRHLQATALSSNSIQLVWIIPAQQNGIITTIEIRWKQLSNTQIRRKRQTAVSGNEHSIVIAVQQQALGMTRKHVVSKLEPYTVYSFRVRERTVNGWGLFTDSIQMTTQEAASSSPADMKVVSTSSSTISISWKTPAEPRGHIKHYVMQCYEEDGVLKYHVNISAGNSVTASYQGVCRNLKSNTETIIEVFAVSSVRGKTGTLKAKTSDKAASGVPWIPIIGGSVGFIAVVALLVTIVLLCRSRPKYEEVNETFDEIELNGGTVKSRPVHISNLKQYIDHNHTNSDHGFFTEYESIKPATAHLTWEHSQQACNQHKNRYSNVVAYDHTRVVLDEISNQEGSTYINANFVDGYKHPRKFIATQGPLPETVDDFWRMIYEQKCHVIIMLTRMIECNRVKCEQYWPDHDSNEYGDIVVTHVDSTELSDYVVRTFSVNTVYDVDQPGQEVKQYHYLGWPDHGVPEYPTSMVTFTKNVMDSVPPKPGPIVVHCSAGVGRTGTLIVIDAMLNQIRDESIVDVYWFISHIRKQRNFMVQTEAQYIFIYDGLLDAVICGNTEVYAKDIAKKCHYLNQHSPDTNDTYLRQEFKRLEAGLSSQEKELFSVANLPENKEKNRFLNILPFNRNRVKLASIYGVKGSDYINASFIDGYRQRHVYIGTQAPLEGTVQDFWRMVWEQNCHNIVMLTKLKEKGQERCYQYWPTCGSETYGKFLVDSLSENEDESSHICQQQLNLTYNETGRSRRVNHHMFTGWPDYGSPNSGRDIIKLVRTIQEMTAIRGNGPVAVHCSGGAGRTGTFIALCICTQKLRAAGSVDIFQTVRQLRTQRPAMVQTIDQYYFIYQALKDFVDTSECLSNNVEFNHETFA